MKHREAPSNTEMQLRTLSRDPRLDTTCPICKRPSNNVYYNEHKMVWVYKHAQVGKETVYHEYKPTL